MPIHPKTITVFLDPSPSSVRRVAHAIEFAKRWNAHLVGVHVVYKGAVLHPSAAFARSEKAMAQVVAHERRMDEACEGARDELGDWFLQQCATAGLSAEFRPITRDKTVDAAIISSLHSDLMIIGHPEPSGLPDDMSAEQILLATRVPLLIIPNDWRGETIGERIMIGWNASPEVRRAVADATCLLVEAASVKALVVDPAGCKWLSGQVGCDIVQHLGRHGAEVELVEARSRGRSIAEVILSEATASGTDLLICGARSPAHLREIVFGNATRKLLAKMPVPVLISH
ncbi:MAG TPA: universal stress protein [Caulobacteraceae bacterium]|nr:universal stress protein [Caulobacteraceae bacterium]